MYGLDQFAATPPLSVIVSLLLIFSCDALGLLMLYFFGVPPPGFKSWQRWQAPIMGAMLLGILLYPLALAGVTSLHFMQIVSSICIAVGFIHLMKSINKLKRFKLFLVQLIKTKEFRIPKLIICLLIFSAWLLALGPITDADSLDYHIGFPIAILNNGGIPFLPEWFHGRLAGNGEVLNALGLSVGAEQFGALLQFSGFLGIAGLLLFGNSEGDQVYKFSNSISSHRLIITIAGLSAPVLIFLITPKPQLLPLSMTTLAFALFLYSSEFKYSELRFRKIFFLISLLVMFAAQAKFTYFLGGGVVGIVSLLFMLRRKLFLSAIWLGLISFSITILPALVWKMHHFHSGFLETLFTPFPGNWPNTDKFELYLRSYRDTSILFPLSLIMPSGVGSITTVIGLGFILFLCLKPGKNIALRVGIFMALFVALTAFFIGPKTSRSYLEPFFWLLIVLSFQKSISNIGVIQKTKWLLFGQGFIAILLYGYGVITLLPGSLTPAWRLNVMNRSAYNYSIFRWADSALPANAVLYTKVRGMGLVPRQSFSSNWASYGTLSQENKLVYLKRFEEKKVTHILVIGARPHNFGELSKGVVKLIAGPSFFQKATRNPFNSGMKYEGWIYEYDIKKVIKSN